MIVNGDTCKKNLMVIRNATKYLQHAYSIIATSNMVTEETDKEMLTAKSQSPLAWKIWEPEEELLLQN